MIHEYEQFQRLAMLLSLSLCKCRYGNANAFDAWSQMNIVIALIYVCVQCLINVDNFQCTLRDATTAYQDQ